MPESPDNIVPITPDARTAAEKFSAEHDRELLTILFTDMVDSTKLQSDLGNVEAARLTELHRKIVRDELAKFDAREIEWAGDSCLAVFTKPSDAVVFALRMQAEHRRVRETEPKLASVRVGMHLGEIVVKTGEAKTDLFGLQVSEAARVMSVARGNQIFCTRAVFDNARGALKGSTIEGVGEVVWVNYGAYMLKGSEDAIELCEVGSSEVAVLKAPQPSDKVSPLLPEGAMAYHPLVPSDGVPTTTRRIPVWTLAVVAAVFALLGVLVGRSIPESNSREGAGSTPSSELKPLRRLSINLDSSLPLFPGAQFQLAVSPDESLLVYTSGDLPDTFLVKRRLDQLEGEPMSGTEGASDPFFSPEGQWIGFWDRRNYKLKKVSVLGGSPVTLCDTEGQLIGGFWAVDGYILLSIVGKGVQRVPDAGGIPEEVTTLAEGELTHLGPRALPGSKTILYTSVKNISIEGISIMAYSYETQESWKLLDGALNAQYLATGHLVYGAPGGVMARPFDPEAVAFTGPPVPVGEAEISILPQWDLPNAYTISPGGSLLYARDVNFSQRAGALRSLVWVDRSGVETPVNDPPKAYMGFRVSPDGGMIAYSIIETDQFNPDIWLYDLTRNQHTPLTFDPLPDTSPIWTPDGRHVDFESLREGAMSIYRRAADHTGSAERLIAAPGFLRLEPAHWMDSESLILTMADTGRSDLFIFSPKSDEKPRNLLETPFNETHPRVSPDGRWIAYASDSSNRSEVYVQRFPEMEGRWQISTDGGNSPLWSPDGSELYFRNGEAVLSVSIETEPTFKQGLPELLFEGPYVPGQYDLAPDGERFLMLKPVEEDDRDDEEASRNVTEIVIVENWVENLERLAPVPEGE